MWSLSRALRLMRHFVLKSSSVVTIGFGKSQRARFLSAVGQHPGQYRSLNILKCLPVSGHSGAATSP
jgi:hypothetical protein